MSYNRVIPRDLFNEAKLLKCLGQLSLIIHDGVGVPRGLELRHDDELSEGFVIWQHLDDGAIFCANLECTFAGRLIGLRSPYNSKDAYPLRFVCDDDEGSVFEHDGLLSQDFIALLQKLEGSQ